MAKLEIDGMDKLLKELERLGDKTKVSDIAKKAVKAAQPVNVKHMKESLASSENAISVTKHKMRRTGSVAKSVRSTPVKENEYGVYAVAKVDGYDPKGVANAYKAQILEAGNKNIGARPWRGRAVAAAEDECKRIMEDIIKSEMGAE